MTTVICLLGEPQAGKSSAAKIITELTGWKAGTCSTIIYNVLAKLEGLPQGNWHDVNPPENHDSIREKLVRLGNAMSDEVPGIYPVGLLNQGCQVLDGIRRKEELAALEAHCEDYGIELIKVWISRDNRPALSDNNELLPVHSHWSVTAADIEELTNDITELLGVLQIIPTTKPTNY